jgi:BolA protein
MAVIRALLVAELAPSALAIDDDSHHHAGHAGAAGGAGHFTVRIVSDRFRDLPLLARHVIVADAEQRLRVDLVRVTAGAEHVELALANGGQPRVDAALDG